jgi:hypothetical protein
MKESDAKTKLCPHMMTGNAILAHTSSVVVIAEGGSDAVLKQLEGIFNQLDFKCRGSGCAMWESWTERELTDYIECDRDGNCEEPEGEGWMVYGGKEVLNRYPATTIYRKRYYRYVSTGNGVCGLLSKGCDQ